MNKVIICNQYCVHGNRFIYTVKSSQIWIVIDLSRDKLSLIVFSLIRIFNFVSNQSGNGKYNQIPVDFNNNQKSISLRVQASRSALRSEA